MMSTLRKRTFNGRSVVSILFGMACLFSLAFPPPPKAAARAECAWYLTVRYYTDATLTTRCGTRMYMCDGTETQVGCETEFVDGVSCTCRE